jgi:hypothetical protein
MNCQISEEIHAHFCTARNACVEEDDLVFNNATIWLSTVGKDSSADGAVAEATCHNAGASEGATELAAALSSNRMPTGAIACRMSEVKGTFTSSDCCEGRGLDNREHCVDVQVWSTASTRHGLVCEEEHNQWDTRRQG